MSTSAVLEVDQPDQQTLVENIQVRSYPQLIKYMGSKARIIQFVSEAIESVHDRGIVCDLFSGSCSLSGTLGDSYSVLSNDIQHYSAFLGSVYLFPVGKVDIESLMVDALANYKKAKVRIPDNLEYNGFNSLKEFNAIEKRNRALINETFRNRYHLFVKNYSGTWWSAEQCLWIDAIKQAIDKRLRNSEWNHPEYALAMSTLMYAMAYTSQGTGHYAQYRDAKTQSSMDDINIYRQKRLPDLFIKKFSQMQAWVTNNVVDLVDLHISFA